MSRVLDHKKIPIIAASLLLVVGLVCLAVAATTYLVTNRFVATAEQTTGTVTGLEERTSTRRDADGHTRRRTVFVPVVRFTTTDGEAVEFRGSNGSDPPAHDVGDTVTVAYDPDDPSGARIVGFADLYLLPLIFGGVGLVLTAAGVSVLLVRRRHRQHRAWLREHGQRVEAEVTAVRLDTNVRANNRHPYVVDLVWRDPRSGTTHPLRSDRLWTDPRPGIDVGHRVPALIDPARPSRNLVDLPDPA